MRRGLLGAALLLVTVLAVAGCGRTDTIRVAGDECSPARSLEAGTTSHVITRDGTRRTYLVHTPPDYDGSTRTPVVFLFHGLGGDAATIMQTTHMTSEADEHGFILVAPQGRGRVSHWDFRSPISAPSSDLGLARSMVASLKTQACVDAERVYAAGFSNGSALTMALACDGSTPFAAYAAVSAPYWTASCGNAPPAPVIYFHGMLDKVVPFAGADTVIGPLPPVDDALTSWVAHDGCAPTGATTTVSRHVRHYSWTSCRAGSEVEMYAVDNGGHRWPGGGQVTTTPGGGDGVTTQDIDASALIWSFFARHTRGGR